MQQAGLHIQMLAVDLQHINALLPDDLRLGPIASYTSLPTLSAPQQQQQQQQATPSITHEAGLAAAE